MPGFSMLTMSEYELRRRVHNENRVLAGGVESQCGNVSSGWRRCGRGRHVTAIVHAQIIRRGHQLVRVILRIRNRRARSVAAVHIGVPVAHQAEIRQADRSIVSELRGQVRRSRVHRVHHIAHVEGVPHRRVSGIVAAAIFHEGPVGVEFVNVDRGRGGIRLLSRGHQTPRRRIGCSGAGGRCSG